MKADDAEAAWTFLLEVNMGSRYMREQYGSAENGECPEIPEPPHIAKVINCFNEFLRVCGNEKQASATYSSLSVFSHPNCSAFMHHFDWAADSPENAKVTFAPPSLETLVLALLAVAIALVAFLQSGTSL
jgi:hypothetical protein